MLKILWIIVILVVGVLLTALITYKSLPENVGRKESIRLPVNPEGNMAKHLVREVAAHKGESGLYPLAGGRDAFAARLALAENAQYSIDVQYYIWHDDVSGRLLMQSLKKAADRGVRVRMLLDDNTMAGMDGLLAALNSHPNIEVRLFNPFMQRGFRPLGFLSDFFRLNRRMHNKSFTADSVVSIVGGRNIGDEYFDVGSGVLFADLDVAAVGKAAEDVSEDFDRYWADMAAYPLETITGKIQEADLDTVPSGDPVTQAYLKALAESDFAGHLRGGNLPLVWAKTQLISDDPAKVHNKALAKDTVMAKIAPIMAGAEKELLIVSPYFVPGKRGTALLNGVAEKGGNVAVLTNSLAANDVAVVHSGYAKYRKDLLKGGVALYELKADATVRPKSNHFLGSSSGASLHAKTFSVDGRYLFVGSFNMDPRSAILNTEMGLMVDNEELAAQLGKGLKAGKHQYTYMVEAGDKGGLQWRTGENGREVVYNDEPHSTWVQRATVWVASKLPIEWLL